MVEFTQGDLLRAETEALVNTVNCVGVMGRGVALQFKIAYPENYDAYAAACKHGEVMPGRMFITESRQLGSPRYIINFPTKRHWRGKSRLEDIRSGLAALVSDLERLKIRSVALPPLGAGLGGLDWQDVKALIVEALGPLPQVKVLVFEPGSMPDAAALMRHRAVPRMTPGRAALVVLMRRYLAGLMDPFVTLLEVHKLMYFMQEAGQPLRLSYKKAPYGPFAENLGHVLKAMEGYMTSGYGDGGDQPNKRLELVPGAIEDAEAFIEEDVQTQARFRLVADLVAGFETPFGLELLATVHYVAVHEQVRSPEEAVDRVHGWNTRKRRFTSEQITLAWNVLKDKGWLAA